MSNKKSKNILEEKIADINCNYFLKKFIFSKNNFKPHPSREYELADNVIWLDDVLIVMQLKERNENHSNNTDNLKRWFNNKVLKKGIKQIKDTLNYLGNYEKIEIQNERNHIFTIYPQGITNVVKLIVDALVSSNMLESVTVKQISTIYEKSQWNNTDSAERGFKKIMLLLDQGA